MSKYKDMAKEKWHEKKPNTNIRGSVSGMIHRNKNSSSDSSSPTTASRPLSDLRDPNSFAPPPRRTGSGLAPPLPPSSAKRKVITAPSKYQDPKGPPVQPPDKVSTDPALLEARQGPYAAMPSAQQQDEDEGHEAPPPQPYRVDTSGLRTDHLPPPPGRRDGADGRAPPSYEVAVGNPSRSPKPPAPSLPPRLPPRTGSGSSQSNHGSSSPQHTGTGMLNQGAINRLGAAGLSVPGLGIGGGSGSGSPSPRSAGSLAPPPPLRSGDNANAHVNELQNRFSSMSTSSAQKNSPSEGTTWQQKQAALQTASAFQKDPSSMSLSDAKSAASTANNFRQRHGDQVAAGLGHAKSLNQKYGVTNRLGSYAGQQGPHNGDDTQENGAGGSAGRAALMAGVAAKKKPPPPPKKKPGLVHPASPVAPQNDEPPPIPLSTRPSA